MALKFVIIASVLATVWASDVSSALDVDDECSANADEQCALNALQLRAAGPDDGMITKINALLGSKLGQINDHMAAQLKSKGKVPLHVSKGKVSFTELDGMSSLHLSSLKMQSITPPTITLSMSGSFGSALKVIGAADSPMGGQVPVSVSFDHVSLGTQHIVATLDANTGAITKFTVSGVYVNIGGAYANVEMRRPFFARIVSNLVSEKVSEKKGEIAGKMAGKVTEALDKVLNEKVKGAINAKVAGMLKKKMR